ncbi:hypothetical protein ACN4EG_08370 [Alkalinema pantanalense CENA528]|uniref:hypothetical protein n=1 Tax=Alkalinema pantanalense TaxID=1620705 RepID=UPI003D6F9763
MAYTLNDLGKVLLSQLHQITTGGDQTVPPSKDTFVSWCEPGIPFMPEDFLFCAKGLGGGKDAEEDKLLVQQAFNLANLIDFIPDPRRTYNNDQQQTIFSTSEARLSHLYGEILRFSKVVSYELSDKEKAKLEKFRNLLRAKKVVKDIITDEEKEVTEDGPVKKAYDSKMVEYIAAATEYNAKRIAAQSAIGPEGKQAVADWTNNAQLYRLRVKAAMDAWVSGGYRNEVDQMNAYINQVTQRDLLLWKQRLLEFYDDADQSGLGAGQTFKYTTLIPGNFASSGGWTNYSVSHSAVNSSTRSSTSSWNAGAGVNFGLFSIGGGASGSSQKYSSNFGVSSFKLSFELAQIVISRPWFYPEFFMNRGWTLRKGEGWTYGDMPSDGAAPPNGNLVGYPTTILFARNISIESAEFVSAYREFSKQVSGGGSVGWGPIRLSGGYSHGSKGTDYNSDAKGATLKVPGMQIIGFVNHLIPKSPNPLPELKDAEFN